MSGKWVLWFDECGSKDVSRVGGKCANLGEMIRIGLPVPPGFAVTTAAYEKFLAETGTGREIEEYLATLRHETKAITEFEEASSRVQGIIKEKEIPGELRVAVFRAYEELSERCSATDLPVAVRSSGVAEDMPTSSFAGQYESYLNLRGKEEILDKVKLCWASLFTTRAIFYRVRKSLPINGGSIGIAVQRMVKVRSAGVCFTVDPNTGDTSKIILEGNWGAGESVVRGIVNPDRYIIDKESLTLTSQIRRKQRKVALKEEGTEEEDIPGEEQGLPCLREQEALKVAELAMTVELHYGSPQDIEWAVEQDVPFPKNTLLVQARPVTSIPAKKASEPAKSVTDQIIDLILKKTFEG